MKKFDMTVYEVEEMTQRELIEVNGGLDPITWTILGVIFTAIGAVAAVLALVDNGPTGYHTVELEAIIGEQGYVVLECGMHQPHIVYGHPGQKIIMRCSWPVSD